MQLLDLLLFVWNDYSSYKDRRMVKRTDGRSVRFAERLGGPCFINIVNKPFVIKCDDLRQRGTLLVTSSTNPEFMMTFQIITAARCSESACGRSGDTGLDMGSSRLSHLLSALCWVIASIQSRNNAWNPGRPLLSIHFAHN